MNCNSAYCNVAGECRNARAVANSIGYKQLVREPEAIAKPLEVIVSCVWTQHVQAHSSAQHQLCVLHVVVHDNNARERICHDVLQLGVDIIDYICVIQSIAITTRAHARTSTK